MKMDEVLSKCLPMTTGSDEEILKDQISHFILRIAYCRTYAPTPLRPPEIQSNTQMTPKTTPIHIYSTPPIHSPP
jgi:hypothetical protein